MNTIGLGNALVDVLLKLENDDVLAEVGIQKGAMDMINQEQMIKIRKSQEGLERSQAPGGSVCNTMRAMAILGAKAGFIGKIGSDSVGEYYEEALKKANVSPYFAKTDGISGSCTVLISPDGERTMGTFGRRQTGRHDGSRRPLCRRIPLRTVGRCDFGAVGTYRIAFGRLHN